MWLLLSGEGLTDIGSCVIPTDYCEPPDFQVGPMTCVIDKLVQDRHDYSPLEYEVTAFIPKSYLSRAAKILRLRRSPSLPGLKRAKETQYFERNARVLAKKAKNFAEEKNDAVVAVLFRDSDGTHSDGRGIWENKRDSIVRGFEMEEFETGVPMVAKPKSEAWLLCAVKNPPYQHCKALENESGNDNSPNHLKQQLDNATGRHLSADEWCQRSQDNNIDLDRIDMPSFRDFKERFIDVLEKL